MLRRNAQCDAQRWCVLYSGPGWLIHQSDGRVRKYGNDVPGSLLRPNACVSVKLPIGVAEAPSLGVRVMPCEPMCAVIPLPYFSQPPPGALYQACRCAVVRPRETPVTVITRVAW